MFKASLMADMMTGNKAQREAVETILPMLDDEQRAELHALIREREVEHGKTAFRNKFHAATPDATVDDARETLTLLADTLVAHGVIKSSGTDGGFYGYSLTLPTVHGVVRMTLKTDRPIGAPTGTDDDE